MELSCPSCGSAFSRGKGWTVSAWTPCCAASGIPSRRSLLCTGGSSRVTPWARQGQLSCSFSCGSCQRHKQQIKHSLSLIMCPTHEPSPALTDESHGKYGWCTTNYSSALLGSLLKATFVLEQPLKHHVLRSWEWENTLNMREIHSIHSFRASSTAFFDCDKNIAWILLENIWPPIVKGLFRERRYFYSGHQLL